MDGDEAPTDLEKGGLGHQPRAGREGIFYMQEEWYHVYAIEYLVCQSCTCYIPTQEYHSDDFYGIRFANNNAQNPSHETNKKPSI